MGVEHASGPEHIESTKGVSPKVRNPALVLLAGSVVLWIVGERDVAVGLFVAAVGGGGIGAASRPGRVR